MKIHEGMQMMLALYCKLCEEKKKANTVQTTLDKFSIKKQNTLTLKIPNVLNNSVLYRATIFSLYIYNGQ